MLLYFEGVSFPGKSFLIICFPDYTVARVKAKLLHIFYDMGILGYQFRLFKNGKFLLDVHQLRDYDLWDKSVVVIQPMQSGVPSRIDTGSDQFPTDPITKALLGEVRVMDKREKLINILRPLKWFHLIMTIFLGLTPSWYLGLISFLMGLWLFKFLPVFTRTSGFLGKMGYQKRFILVYSCACFLIGSVSVYGLLNDVLLGGSSGGVVTGVIATGLYALNSIACFVAAVASLMLVRNMHFQLGDFIEDTIIRSKDIPMLFEAAKEGGTMKRRAVALELANVAGTNPEQEDISSDIGIGIILNLVLSEDIPTQEYAIEALEEISSHPNNQRKVVKQGAFKALLAVVHVDSDHILYHGTRCINLLVSNENTRDQFIEEGGLNEIAELATRGGSDIERMVAAVFLDLTCNNKGRKLICRNVKLLETIAILLYSDDKRAKKYALQALEIVCVDDPAVVLIQERVLTGVLQVTLRNVDSILHLLACNILFYFTQDRGKASALCRNDDFVSALYKLTYSPDESVLKASCRMLLNIIDEEANVKSLMQRGLFDIVSYAVDVADDDMAVEMRKLLQRASVYRKRTLLGK
eukprot:Nk52_evm122s221 gene=Nk52_evmTU122s221